MTFFRKNALTPSRAPLLGALFVLGTTLFSSPGGAVGTRHFVLESGADFKKGTLEGASVDSSGFLRPGLELGSVEVPDAASVWDVLEDEGGLLLATGNSGKLFRVKAGKVTEVAKAEAMALTSIERAFGKVIVGTMPGGKLYELKGDKLIPFTELKEGEHIWDLAFDPKSQALYAATGPSGKLYRITADGTAQVYFDAPQGHLVSVAASGGRVLCGSSEAARLYEVKGPGRAEVLFDFPATEVRQIAFAKDGGVFFLVNELKGGPRSDNMSKTDAKTPSKSSAQSGSGSVYRVDSNGRIEKLFSESSDHFISLSVDAQGRPIVGTGAEGKVYRIEENHESALIGDVEERQVSAVLGAQKGGWVVASDPVAVHPVTGVGGQNSVWTSEVLDAGIRARFGRMSWDSSGKVALSTRSGNTKDPDETWSDWSQDLAKPGLVASAPGRYLQVRVRLLSGEDSRLSRIDIPFLTDNLRPVVTEVTAKSVALPEGSNGVSGSGAPLSGKATSKVKLSWQVDNPDEDELRYRVDYRLAQEKEWISAQRPDEILTSSSFDWETEDLPEGRYRVRVTATDELSNPPSRVQSHFLTSEEILVDNTPPRFEKLSVQGSRLTGIARDGVGPVRRLEIRVAGQPEWIPFEPKDGIFDSEQETFELDLSLIPQAPGALVTVRVFDTAGNSEVSHLRVPGAR